MRDAAQRPLGRVVAGFGGKRTSIFLSVLLAAAALVVLVLPRLTGPEPSTITYSELIRGVEQRRVAAVAIQPGVGVEGEWAAGAREFRVVYPVADPEALAARLEAAGVRVSFMPPPDGNRFREILAITLQLLVFAGLGWFLYLNLKGQQGNGDVGGAVTGGTTSFDDVAGTQGAAEEMREVVEFLRDPSAFSAMGARVPKGVLLLGPPGTGKTLLARAVAGEAGVPFFQISGSEITGFIVGLGAQRIRSLFRKARKAGGVIFIDEIDSLGGKRGRNRAHNEDDRTLNQLLVEMDGFAASDGVVVIGATNRPDDLDPALKRPGRFDRQITVGLPTSDGREAILRLHVGRRKVPLAADVDLARLARITPGATGADLANLINEAAIAAVREGATLTGWQHFEIARDRMLLGKERAGFRAPEREWRTVAYHEAGHAIAGVLSCPEDGLHKVTIQPRGQAMGVAHFAPDDDRHLYSRKYLEGQIIKGLGGRAAEEIAFGPDAVTGGAESDLVQVNRIARRMVYRLGMGERTGFLVQDEEGAPLSAEAQTRMDEEVRQLLDRSYARALSMMITFRGALDALAEALLERETLDGLEVLELLEREGLPSPALTRIP